MQLVYIICPYFNFFRFMQKNIVSFRENIKEKEKQSLSKMILCHLNTQSLRKNNESPKKKQGKQGKQKITQSSEPEERERQRESQRWEPEDGVTPDWWCAPLRLGFESLTERETESQGWETRSRRDERDWVAERWTATETPIFYFFILKSFWEIDFTCSLNTNLYLKYNKYSISHIKSTNKLPTT